MQKIPLTLIAITLLLTLTGLAVTNQNLKLSPVNKNEVVSDVAEESPENIEGNTQTAQTNTQPNNSGDQTLNLGAETNQNMENQNLDEKCNHQSEDIQTLENSAQNQNSNQNNLNLPDGRIYYPTSSEEPYAYTPTYTPKETNMPIIPTILQD